MTVLISSYLSLMPGITTLERLIGRALSESEEAVFVKLSRRLTLRFRLTRLFGMIIFSGPVLFSHLLPQLSSLSTSLRTDRLSISAPP
jgi:hypothetical protein